MCREKALSALSQPQHRCVRPNGPLQNCYDKFRHRGPLWKALLRRWRLLESKVRQGANKPLHPSGPSLRNGSNPVQTPLGRASIGPLPRCADGSTSYTVGGAVHQRLDTNDPGIFFHNFNNFLRSTFGPSISSTNGVNCSSSLVYYRYRPHEKCSSCIIFKRAYITY